MSADMERALIGALIMNPGKAGELQELRPDMFTSPQYADYYAEFQAAFREGIELDYRILCERLIEKNPDCAQIIYQDLADCNASVFYSGNVGKYADMIIDDYRTRQAGEAVSRVRFSRDNLDDQIQQTINTLQLLQRRKDGKAQTLAEIAAEQKDKYFKPREGSGIMIGLDKVDAALGGIDRGDVVVIAARPAVGKSAMALQIARRNAREGKKIAYFNCEMRPEQIYERALATSSGINLSRIRLATDFVQGEKELFEYGNKQIEGENNVVIFSGSKNVSGIRSAIAGKYFDCVIIDYLGLIRPDRGRGANRYAEVGDVSRGIKAIAMDENIPVILLSQLNRASEGKADKEPALADLRESGDIEQDATAVLMLWAPDQDDKSKRGLKVAKARNGYLTKLEMVFEGQYMTFREEDDADFEETDENPFI